MPTLSIPNTFVPFTKIYSAEVNANFTAISTLLNTTKLDSTNLQDGGINVSKLSTNGGTAGQFIGNNGSTVVWASNPIQNVYNIVVGSSAQVTAGIAQYATMATAIAAASAGDRIIVLPGYNTAETVTINKQLYVTGLGRATVISGDINFTASSDFSYLTNLKVIGNINLLAGADGVVCDPVWLASSTTSFVVDSTVTGEYLLGIQET